MKSKASCALLFLLPVPAILSAQSRPSRAEETKVAVEIVIYNSAEVPRAVLDASRAYAGEVFRLAGVHLEWTLCTEAEADRARCGRQPGLNQIAVRLLRRPKDRKVDFAANTGGVAIRGDGESGSGYITVYYDRVEEIAKRVNGCLRCVLGNTLAHEIGHLLLPAGSHSKTGVMQEEPLREDWRKVEMGVLLFTKQQAEAMQAGFAARRGVVALAEGKLLQQ